MEAQEFRAGDHSISIRHKHLHLHHRIQQPEQLHGQWATAEAAWLFGEPQCRTLHIPHSRGAEITAAQVFLQPALQAMAEFRGPRQGGHGDNSGSEAMVTHAPAPCRQQPHPDSCPEWGGPLAPVAEGPPAASAAPGFGRGTLAVARCCGPEAAHLPGSPIPGR